MQKYFCTQPQNRYFPVVLGVREQRFPARRVFTLQAETRGNYIERLVFNNVNRRKRQFILNKMDVSSHLLVCCVVNIVIVFFVSFFWQGF
jgi:hypothetical protein